MKSPGWLIVCSKCGAGEVDGFTLYPVNKTPDNGADPVAVYALHAKEYDDGEWAYECPIASPETAAEDRPTD